MTGGQSKAPMFLKQVWHRIVGVRSGGSGGSVNAHIDYHPTTSTRTPSSMGTTTTTTTEATSTLNKGAANNFGKSVAAAASTTYKDIANHRLVFLGEIHSMPPIIAFQRQIQAEMLEIQKQQQQQQQQEQTSSSSTNTVQQQPILHVIIEHISFDEQVILDEYMTNEQYTFDDLVLTYNSQSDEKHDLYPYKDLFEDAKKSNGQIKLHAGFIPRKYARMWMKDGPNNTREVIPSHWLPPPAENDDDDQEDWIFNGTEFHYNVFESFFTGRSITTTSTSTSNKQSSSSSSSSPTDQFRNIFKAQILKDVAMANKINTLIGDDTNKFLEDTNQKLLVIAGNGHLKYYTGVPERVLYKHPKLATETCLVISESINTTTDDDNGHDIDGDDNERIIIKELQNRYGDTTREDVPDPADYIYFYRLPEVEEDNFKVDDKVAAAKEETKKAYDKVGESAQLPGNMAKAAWIMYNMGYTEDQFHVAGSDAYNFQGVGNPHFFSNIQPGEFVVDVGSGLGVDSFIAQHATGSSGKVIGIDLSSQQVKHSQRRAIERNIDDTGGSDGGNGKSSNKNIQFLEADMDNIPIPDNSVDVIISNGAFCLAPNKEQAFRELYRILKPGGRISVCTTTIIQEEGELEPGVDWPLCMKMFISKQDIEPMCARIGFTNILVDDSDSSMTMEIPEEVLSSSSNNPNRNRVHVGGDDFNHLEDYDMDKICARVCIVATKPLVS